MAVQIDGVPPVGLDNTGITVTLGVAAPGGGVAIRILIDDTIVPSRTAALHIIEKLEYELRRRDWPVA